METQIFYSSENEHLEKQFEQIIQTISELIKTNPSNRKCLKDVQDNCKAQLRRIKALKPECKHEYVTDTIDITPEKSQQITYCVFCESTK